MCFTGWNENTAKSAYLPFPHLFLTPLESIKEPPGEWAASSIIQRLYSSANFLNSSRFTGFQRKNLLVYFAIVFLQN